MNFEIIFSLKAASFVLILKMGQSGSNEDKENQFLVHDRESGQSVFLLTLNE